MYRFSKASLGNRAGVDQRLIEISDLALELTPIDFGIPRDGGLRTADRQQDLYLAGKSKCDGTLNKSLHQSGMALDFYAYVNGRASWDVGHLSMVAAAHLQAAAYLGYPIRWGGFFKPFASEPFNHGWDCCHIELMEQ